jgi:hypothetical protein
MACRRPSLSRYLGSRPSRSRGIEQPRERSAVEELRDHTGEPFTVGAAAAQLGDDVAGLINQSLDLRLQPAFD